MMLKIRFQSPEAACIDLKKLCKRLDMGLGGDSRESNGPTETTTIKDDRTTTLYKVKSEIGDLIVKRYNTKNLWHLLRRNFQTSRAVNCLKMARTFKSRGIKVAEPIAVIESRFGPFSGRSWYVSRFVDSIMLADYLGVENWTVPLQAVQGKLQALFNIFLNAELSHGDMKATNLLVCNDGLVVIDLDLAKQHRWRHFHQIALRRDKARFLKNWNNRPGLHNHFERALEHIGL